MWIIGKNNTQKKKKQKLNMKGNKNYRCKLKRGKYNVERKNKTQKKEIRT
jgi:hypothetical protein